MNHGSPHPLGATFDGRGVNFAIYSEHARRIELCLFDDEGKETRVPLPERTGSVWHGYLAGIAPGQRYGYRAFGPYEPHEGLRFNPNVVLLDPYARAVDGVERWEAGCFAYAVGDPEADLRMSTEQALGAPRGVVVDPRFEWGEDVPPRTPLHRTVIYEAHVRGLTKLHPGIPDALRGTYAAVAHPAMVRHLRELGITAVELMPIHAFVDEKHLQDQGLHNYWGYNSIGYFAPDVRYRSGGALASEVMELKGMVKALHRAGIEVLLDVVYNHTAEGNHLGPTFSFKGLDNPTYYRLANDPRYYFDYTGTGNTLNVKHPQVLTLIMDSLRYWVEEVHIDGFRFDLASTLARELHEVNKLSGFFTLIHDSPALRDVKLIAEPWDVGPDGYQVGNFPSRWAEWNGRYRDVIRSFWKGEGGQLGELGYRLTGSSDLYESNGRRPSASINFVTAHDGFTLADLVSYQQKHNEANGERNADGTDDNRSWNCGVEGPTDDPVVLALRERQRRNLMATLMFSQGTPMVLGGDELGRSQRGNNNAYCQDNETTWLAWNTDERTAAFHAFTRRIIEIRRAHPALRRARFFQGRPIRGTDLKDIAWFRCSGAPMSDEDWHNQSTKSVSMFLAGRGIDDMDEQGRALVDDNLFLVLNSSHEDDEFTLPALAGVTEAWHLLVDTADDHAEEVVEPGAITRLVGRSLKLFRSRARVLRYGGAHHTLGATYRLQLTPQFRFGDARAVVEYLARLGVTDVYCSPIFAAVPGSLHGYDVVDHSRLNPELGTEEEFRYFTDELARCGVGLLLDWVPNHMGIASRDNRAWEDVLENGPSALQADTFDIDWQRGRDQPDSVLLPVLGGQYGTALERGELRVVLDANWFRVTYQHRSFPVGPRSALPLLTSAVQRTGLDESDLVQQELQSVVLALGYLSERSTRDPGLRREHAREKEVIKRRLNRLLEDSEAVKAAIAAALEEVNGKVGVASSFDVLDQLLRRQAYRLASWRVAAEEINYRRFFDVNELAAIRMEDPGVFDRAHTLLFRLMDEGRVKALRLDHTDGLYDPLGYFSKLQGRFRRDVSDPTLNPDDAVRPVPVLVEKILGVDEHLPKSWPVDGTTGYELAAAVYGLWVDPAAEEAFTALHRELTSDQRAYGRHVHECKMRTLDTLVSEVNMLAQLLSRIASGNRCWRDFTLNELTRALRETLASFPVYRSYVREGEAAAGEGVSDEDERLVATAVRAARRRASTLDPSLFDFLEAILLLRPTVSGDDRAAVVHFTMRFQQQSGPVMAKSVEDTAFYRYNRLLCLNEVGGDPGRFGTSLQRFHAQNLERARSWPLSMVTLATHDSKRGEDAAARIAVLSEIPAEWRDAVTRWSRKMQPHKRSVSESGLMGPSGRDEYTFYQALVGAWPFGWDGRDGRQTFADRMTVYMEKATREAKVETSWIRPNEEYEGALRGFVEAALADDGVIADVARWIARIDVAGASNALAQTLIKLCVPGVADTYQGSELWNQALVDPDNRRPVDFEHRRRLLAEIAARAPEPAALARDLLARWTDGAIKLYVTHTALRARTRVPELFRLGDYEPIDAGEHVVAFIRSADGQRVIVVAPRQIVTLVDAARPWALGDVWRDTAFVAPHGRYVDMFTGRAHVCSPAHPTLRVADVLAEFPVALLCT